MLPQSFFTSAYQVKIIDFANYFYRFRKTKYGTQNGLELFNDKTRFSFDAKSDFIQCIAFIKKTFDKFNIIIVGKINSNDHISIEWINSILPIDFVYINVSLNWETFDTLPHFVKNQKLKYIKQYDDYICWLLADQLNATIISNDKFRDKQKTKQVLKGNQLYIDIIHKNESSNTSIFVN